MYRQMETECKWTKILTDRQKKQRTDGEGGVLTKDFGEIVNFKTNVQTNRSTNKETDTQQTHRQMEREANGQTNKQTDEWKTD